MYEIELKEEIYQEIKESCLDFYDEKCIDLFKMLQELMDIEGVPMHYPYHHYIVPAVLLTACHVVGEDKRTLLEENLDESMKRGKNVLAGFCGLYGACGAAVGVGIFHSIYYGINPMSNKGYAKTNRITADVLQKISEVEGPRCCKRSCFFSMLVAAENINEDLGFNLKTPKNFKCKYSPMNKDCKKQECPFFDSNHIIN